jgi:nitrite reductase/ring-hydroxylating ferredoxin subunit
MTERVTVGTTDELLAKGTLTAKVGSQPVCVFWSEGKAYAVDDRCPHMGFPLHRGTVENGLLTCHWHHARFDLESGGTLDPFADDVRAYPVETAGGQVVVVVEPAGDRVAHLRRRLDEGLEQGLTLVLAKAVLGLSDILGPEKAAEVVLEAGVEFGTRYRDAGWGAGLTVLTAMANVLPVLDPADRPLALVHGLVFVSRDTRGRAPRFALDPLAADVGPERLSLWYRRFVGTRNGDAAERTLATATAAGLAPDRLADVMGRATFDHVFIDGGHTIDFTNKAFEVLDHIGWEDAGRILPTLAHQTAGASRAEETGAWRHPYDLVALLARPAPPAPGQPSVSDDRVEALAWTLLGDDPGDIVAALDKAAAAGATPEQQARAVAYAAALRVTRFHTDNDHADWDVVHHGFTTANAVHQLIRRSPGAGLRPGVYQGALKVFLDRFLNVPAARLRADEDAAPERSGLTGLAECWDQQGMVDRAGAIVYGWLLAGGSQAEVISVLGSALLREDAEFHWFQTYEAAVRQAGAWPPGSEPSARILAGTARFLAAHTPTRRELPQVVRIASRLRRGEPLYEDDEESEDADPAGGAT